MELKRERLAISGGVASRSQTNITTLRDQFIMQTIVASSPNSTTLSPCYTGPTADDLARIPDELKARPQWVLWRGEDRIDQCTGAVKLNKIPIDPQTLRNADTTDPATWGTFAHCVAALPSALEQWQDENPDRYRGGGIGFVVTTDDEYCGIDLDKCRNPSTGILASDARTIIDALQSYSEISPSTTGIRILLRGKLPPHGRRHGTVEMYETARFFTITGWHLPDTPTTIETCQEALHAMHARLFAAQQAPQHYTVSSVSLEDTVLLEKARTAQNGSTFAALYAGDIAAYASQSEADMALCCRLAFWTQETAQIDRLFRASGLMRDKWDTRRGDTTYGARTITEALARQTEHYTGRNGTDAAQRPPETPYGPTWQETFLRTKGGDIKETYGNLVLALQHTSPWDTQCWYDVVRELPMCGTTTLSDAMVGQAALDLERNAGIPIRNLRMVQAALVYHCREKPRDLLQQWLDALPPWDQVPRLTEWLHDHAGAKKTAYGMDISRLLPVSMVARALDPGCQYRNVVIFEGPEDAGKSKLVKALASPTWYREISHSLEGKEAHMIVAGAWVAEFAELSSLSKTEDVRMKSFITMEADEYVPKFANAPVKRLRRTIFVGTVNPEGDGAYLRGQTGNTRFLPLKVETINIDDVLAMRTQLFAEAVAYYHAHPDDWWQLSSDGHAEAVEQRNARRQCSVYEDTLAAWLSDKASTTWEDIAEHYLKLEAKEKWKDKVLQADIAKALHALGWTRKQKKVQGKPIWCWFSQGNQGNQV